MIDVGGHLPGLLALLKRGHAQRKGGHVFITGMSRSGTSALRATFEAQPAFGARTDLSVETELFQNPMLLFAPTSTKGAKAYRFVPDEDAAAALAATLAPLRVPVAALGRFAPRRAEAFAHPMLLRAFFATAAARVGSTHIVEKTPGHLAVVDRIVRTFPNARIVVCVRHPLDRLSSFRKRAAREHDPTGATTSWFDVTTDEFIRDYATRAGLAVRAMTRWPKGVRIVRYEDLTAAPEDVVGTLFEWCGQSFDVEVDRARIQASSARAGRPIESTARDWTDHVDAGEAAHVMRMLRVPAGLLGYHDHG